MLTSTQSELFSRLPTPSYVTDAALLKKNLSLLNRVQSESGARILLALKGYAQWAAFPLIRNYLQGVTASSPAEAQLGAKRFRKEVHAYAPAYSENDIRVLRRYTRHISFNSIAQYTHLSPQLRGYPIQTALRINPEHSEVKKAIYDPCAPNSRLGVTAAQLKNGMQSVRGISGLHFHTLCELGSDALERTLTAVEHKFGFFFNNITWINFGGGHHITRDDYDIAHLITLIKTFRSRYPLTVYLEPGEAIALNTGYLIATVLDIIDNGMHIAILDTSAAAHMPDVLEMPYRPRVIGSGMPDEKKYTYRLGGITCLAGDIIGDYSFDEPLTVGSRIVFEDMAHYSMVKNNTFNGVQLPSQYIIDSDRNTIIHEKHFSYRDYERRLS